MTTWVVDVSPLIFLAKLGRLELLRDGADVVCAPRAVLTKVRAQSDEATLTIERASQMWLSVRQVSNQSAVEILLADLDLGEADLRALRDLELSVC